MFKFTFKINRIGLAAEIGITSTKNKDKGFQDKPYCSLTSNGNVKTDYWQR